jgi:RHS repeat-associated protein
LPVLLRDGPGTNYTYYIHGPGGLPVEQINGTTALFYHHDQLGSTRLITDGTGLTQATYGFDVYGNLTASTGTVASPLRFAGQYWDSESGLYYLRARYYDPATAQFLTRDPWVALTHAPYSYAGDNPLNAADPSGRCVEDACVGEAAAVIWILGLLGVAVTGETAIQYNAHTHFATGNDATPADSSSRDATNPHGVRERAKPCFDDPSISPGEGWEWRGAGPPQTGKGSWWNPRTEESLHPDLGHGGQIGPHYDYQPRTPSPGAPFGYRWFPDGSIQPKGPMPIPGDPD